jgi:bla regulator protein blaR1
VVAKKGPKLGAAKPADGQPASPMVRGHIAALKMSMARLAGSLAADVGSQVVDETGLPGECAFTLDWNPDDIQGLGRDGNSDRPSVFTALEEQLGLKLEAVKRPVDQLVIDRTEKPSEN